MPILDDTTVSTTPPPAFPAPIAEHNLHLPGGTNALGAVLERDDTEDETPYVGVFNSGGVGVDFTRPEDVRACAQQIARFAEQVTELADRLAALQAEAGR